MRKWLIRAGAAIVVLIVLAYIGLQVYLNTSHATNLVASKLEPIVGGPVELGGLSVGVTGTSVSNLKLFAEGAEDPWLTVDEIDADLSLFDLIGGSTNPKSVGIEGANLVIEIDADGRLKTKFPDGGSDEPGDIPKIALKSATLVLRQEGKPEAKLTGLDAELRSEDGKLLLEGTLDDPDWSKWTLDADIQADGSSGTIHLATESAVADMDRLRGIPYIPEEVWEEVTVTGPTSADVTLNFGDQEPAVTYTVKLRPTGADVTVPSIDAEFTGLQGDVTIEQAVVTLKGVTGAMAGGDLKADAKLDFGPEEPVLEFDIAAEKLDVARLPASWQFPQKISGNLNGNAELKLTLTADGPKYDGSGTGKVLDAKLGTIEVDGPIEIDLKPTKDGYSFGQNVSRNERNETQWEDRKPNSDHFFSSRPLRALRETLSVSLATGLTLFAQAPPEEKETESDEGFLEIKFGLKEVDLQELFKQIEVDVPLQLSGKLTTQVKVGIPTDATTDFKKYRVDGTAELPAVTIEGVELRQVTAKVTYRDGVLTLDDFSGSLPDAGGTAGTYSGTAKLGVFPAGDLTANLKLTSIPWRNLAAVAGGVITDPSGDFSGEATLNAPAGNLSDIKAWRASFSLESKSLKAFNWTLAEPKVATNLENGVLKLTEFSGSLEGVGFTGDGELTVTEPYPFKASLKLAESDLTALNRLSPSLRPPVAIEGKLTAQTTATGTLSPLDFEAGGTIVAKGLAVEGFKVGEADLKWAVDEEKFSVSELKAKLYDGDVTGSATFPYAEGAAGEGAIKFTGVDLGAMTKAIKDFPLPLEGKASGTITAQLPAEGPPGVKLEDISAPNLKVSNIPTKTLTGTGSYQDGKFTLKVEGEALLGKYNMEVTYPVEQKDKEQRPGPAGSVHLHEMRLAPLWQPLGLQAELGSLDGRLHLDFDFTTDPDTGELTGTGEIRVATIQWENRTVTDQIAARIDLAGNTVRLANVTGAFAGGRLNADATVDLSDGLRGTYSLTLDGAEAEQLLAFVDLGDQIDGRVKLRARGRITQGGITGRGDVQLARARFGEIPLTSASVPLDWQIGSGRGQLRIRGGSATLAGGRVRLRADYRFGSGGGLDGQADFSDVDLGELLKPFTDSSFGKGKATGRVDFDSDRPGSLNDLNARLSGQLEQASAASLPILDQVSRTVPGMRSVSGRSQDGSFDIIVSRGAIRIRDLSLASSSLQLFIEGTSTLAGRLNLTVIVATQPIAPAPLLRLATNVIPVGPVPLSVILRLGELLANRTIQLSVTGTISSPVIRINPLRTLSEEAVRSFLGGAPGLPGR